MRYALTRLLPLLLLGGCLKNEGPNLTTITPEIAVFPEALDFGETIVLQTMVQQLAIQNAASVPLEISELRIDDPNGVFSLTDTSGTVDGDSTWTLPVTFSPQTFLVYDATLTIVSNDEETPEVVVPLVGEGVDAPMPDISVTPLTLDFGTVAVGGTATNWFELVNEGDAPLTMGIVDQTGSGAFTMNLDPSNMVIGPGDDVLVVITYAPGNDLGDSGWLTFHSDDPDEPVIEALMLGNGGGDFAYPEAVIDCPGTSAPPQWVTLDGSGSIDPLGGSLMYLWSLVQTPDGSAGYLNQFVTDTTELYTDIAGTYEVQLIVTNEQGTISAPERCFVEAIPADDLHIELTWDTPDHDMDLHLIDNDWDYYDEPGDCTHCNTNPDWGAGGSDDDPRLDLDDRYDGPENINVLHPADGTYHVKVHYYSGGGAVTATVKVWSYGTEVYSASKVMKYDEVWDVGQVNWPDGTVAPANTALYKSPYRDCY